MSSVYIQLNHIFLYRASCIRETLTLQMATIVVFLGFLTTIEATEKRADRNLPLNYFIIT